MKMMPAGTSNNNTLHKPAYYVTQFALLRMMVVAQQGTILKRKLSLQNPYPGLSLSPHSKSEEVLW